MKQTNKISEFIQRKSENIENNQPIVGEYEYILQIDACDVIIKQPTHKEKMLRTLNKIKTHVHCCRKKPSTVAPES